MPIENELKYVLDVPSAHKFRNLMLHQKNATGYVYRQGYLNDNTRIREVKDSNTGEVLETLFTFKMMVNGKLVEIEDNISQADFDLLWIKVERVMLKSRVKVPVGNRIWEVDFMHTSDGNETYLVMAEVEMGEDETDPGALPDFISEHLLYAVPQGDMRFVNNRLTQPNAVKKLIQDIKDGKL
jgi:CYTH domain-containing protein